MAEELTALLEHYRQMREALLSAIQGVSDELLIEPSLDGWSVKDHLAHLATWDDIRASEVARISAGHESAWRMSDEQVAAYNELRHASQRSVSLNQIRWELATSRQRLLEALDAATPRGLDASRYAAAALRSTHEAEHTGWISRWRNEQRI